MGWILRTSSIIFIYIHSRYIEARHTHTPTHTDSESCDSFTGRMKRVSGPADHTTALQADVNRAANRVGPHSASEEM